jgi:hypothetical protein
MRYVSAGSFELRHDSPQWQTGGPMLEFGIHESDGAPDEKERRPKHNHLVTKRA